MLGSLSSGGEFDSPAGDDSGWSGSPQTELWKLYFWHYPYTMSSISNMRARHGKGMVPANADGTGSRIQVFYRPIEDLKLDPFNPRVHTAQQVRQIARSIGLEQGTNVTPN